MLTNLPIYISYSKFFSIIRQQYEIKQLYTPPKDDFNLSAKINSSPVFIEPDPETVFEEMCDLYYFLSFYETIINSCCSEFSQRFMIMKNAVDTVSELIDDLTLSYNKERQSIITNELSEIISTIKAINQGKN